LNSKLKTKKDPPNVWACVLINQLAFPGMGTVMARRRFGYLQSSLMVTGFILVMGFMLWFFVCFARSLSGPDGTPGKFFAQVRPYLGLGLLGLGFCVLSWFWALFSSIGMLSDLKDRAANAPPARASAPPPPLPEPKP
jgi:hypothetical protein